MTISRRATATAVALLSLAIAALTGAGPASAAGPSCPDLVPYDQTVFSHPTQIDGRWLPISPGTRRVYTGTVQGDQGLEAHTVTFTVTDVTKVVQGVKSVAVWDVDSGPTGVQESELSLWAQDDAGYVWNMGEYPEEYDATGQFVGAPSTWLAGERSATPGIHMGPAPVVSSKFYSQGYAPTIEF